MSGLFCGFRLGLSHLRGALHTESSLPPLQDFCLVTCGLCAPWPPPQLLETSLLVPLPSHVVLNLGSNLMWSCPCCSAISEPTPHIPICSFPTSGPRHKPLDGNNNCGQSFPTPMGLPDPSQISAASGPAQCSALWDSYLAFYEVLSKTPKRTSKMVRWRKALATKSHRLRSILMTLVLKTEKKQLLQAVS